MSESVVIICGAPNAGKSSLFNALIGENRSAVSDKPQTTQRDLCVCASFGETHFAILDTPGIQHTRGTAKPSESDSCGFGPHQNIILVVVDISRRDCANAQRMIEEIFAKHAADTSEFIIVFNKIDKINKTELISRLAVFQTYTKSPKAGGLGCERVSAFFMVSVKNNDGVDDVRKYIAGRLGNQMKLGDSLDARDQLNGVNTVTTREERTFEKTKTSTFKPAKVTTDNEAAALVSELVREQIFQQLHQELPYSLKVEHVFLERQSNVEHFFQDIIVPKHSQKIIVIGHNGETLKSIGHRARLNIERALKRRVYLHLFVKVAKEKDDGKSALSHKNPLNIANHS